MTEKLKFILMVHTKLQEYTIQYIHVDCRILWVTYINNISMKIKIKVRRNAL